MAKSKILIVDDDVNILLLYSDIFKNFEVEADRVKPSLSIRDQVVNRATMAYDLIIMDCKLKERDGTVTYGQDLIRELRDKGFSGYIFANSSLMDNNEEMIKSGADYVVGKLDFLKRINKLLVLGK